MGLLGVIAPILENQMEKKMGHDMEAENKQPVQVHGYWFVLQGFGIWGLERRALRSDFGL